MRVGNDSENPLKIAMLSEIPAKLKHEETAATHETGSEGEGGRDQTKSNSGLTGRTWQQNAKLQLMLFQAYLANQASIIKL